MVSLATFFPILSEIQQAPGLPSEGLLPVSILNNNIVNAFALSPDHFALQLSAFLSGLFRFCFLASSFI